MEKVSSTERWLFVTESRAEPKHPSRTQSWEGGWGRWETQTSVPHFRTVEIEVEK